MADQNGAESDDLTSLTAFIVSAYVSNNSVVPGTLGALIGQVFVALGKLGDGAAVAEPVVSKQAPAVSVKKSVTNDYIICLEDGKQFKSLRRHLASTYNMTPDEYRAKWSLPSDYPMVAPGYSASRSALAKSFGFGRKKAVVEAPAAAPRKVGRPKKVK